MIYLSTICQHHSFGSGISAVPVNTVEKLSFIEKPGFPNLLEKILCVMTSNVMSLKRCP